MRAPEPPFSWKKMVLAVLNRAGQAPLEYRYGMNANCPCVACEPISYSPVLYVAAAA